MKVLENDSIKYWVEDDILFSEFKKETNLTLESVNQLIRLRHKISNNKKQYWCLDLKNVKSYPKEVREYANIHGQDFLHACAAIQHSHVSRFILNSFLKIHKPVIPLKGFNKKEAAISWLKELKQKS
jgi:hypothetical protein